MTDALAAARLARLVHADTIGEPLRRGLIGWSYGYMPPKGCEHLGALSWPNMDPKPPFLAKMLGCRWCVAVWAAFGVTTARRLVPRLWAPVAEALATSYVAAAVATIED